TPSFGAYPGTVTLRVETLLAIVRDVLDALSAHGFRRILIVNGHGGNTPAPNFCYEWMGAHPGVGRGLHSWRRAPLVGKKVEEIDPVASHASWMENFEWTRIAGVTPPDERRPMIVPAQTQGRGPRAMRELLGDGNMGGLHQRPEADVAALWQVAV